MIRLYETRDEKTWHVIDPRHVKTSHTSSELEAVCEVWSREEPPPDSRMPQNMDQTRSNIRRHRYIHRMVPLRRIPRKGASMSELTTEKAIGIIADELCERSVEG